ncbi:hypothetical protein NDU88_001648 [Pleurodeles waltl]|uniref:Uncharacterized protein n=1 Tax=Pleurodeles waltl TaxID=8319 RepID=A0AAV7NFR7_PLEWA|nr:hypothetical protein NDU88_001648 [Pleurodeles waltl]
MNYLAHQGPLVSQPPQPTHSPPQSLQHRYPTPQHPPNIPTPLSPGHCNQKCAHLYRDPSSHLTPKTIRDQVSVAVGTPFKGHKHRGTGTLAQRNRDTGRTAVRQGEDKARQPTLQEAFTNVLGAYQQSQDKMSQILTNMQENKRLQDVHHQEIREDLQALNTTMVSIAGVLADRANIMREWTAHQRAPTTSQSTDQPTTSTAASEQEALPQDPQATSTPPPAEGEPPRKHSLQPRQKPETLAKTKTTARK